MQNVSERDVRVLPVNLVCALDAQVEGWWAIRSIRDADVVVVADLHGLGVSRVGTRVPLAREGDQVIWKGEEEDKLIFNSRRKELSLTRELAEQSSSIKEIRIECWPVVEEQLGGGRSGGGCSICNNAQQILGHVVLQLHEALEQLTVVGRIGGVLEDQHNHGGH